jgi:hypothetical protein
MSLTHGARCVTRCSAVNRRSRLNLFLAQPGVLDDAIPDERRLGTDAGHAWLEVADACVAYTDLGISDGMWRGIEAARQAGVPVEFRKLGRLTIRLLRLAGKPAKRSA